MKVPPARAAESDPSAAADGSGVGWGVVGLGVVGWGVVGLSVGWGVVGWGDIVGWGVGAGGSEKT